MADLFDDGATEDADFQLPGDEESFNRMVENSTDPEVQEMVAEQTEPPAQPRDEKGRFASSQTEGAPETPDLDVVSDQTAAGDDPVARRLAEKDAMIGRQSTEIGQLREQQRQIQEYLAAQAQQQYRQAAPPADWDELIDTNPAYATQLAYANGDQYRYQQAAQAWEEIAPGSHDLWAQNYALQNEIANVRQQTEQMTNHFRRQELGASVQSLTQKYPDLPNMIDQMAQIAPQYPHDVWALSSDNPEVVAGAVESLYLKTRGLHADTLVARSQENAQKLALDEQRAIEGAAVVSATRTGREPAPSMADRIAAEWPDDDPLKSGWNLG